MSEYPETQGKNVAGVKKLCKAPTVCLARCHMILHNLLLACRYMIPIGCVCGQTVVLPLRNGVIPGSFSLFTCISLPLIGQIFADSLQIFMYSQIAEVLKLRRKSAHSFDCFSRALEDRWRNGSAFDSRSKGYPFKSGEPNQPLSNT